MPASPPVCRAPAPGPPPVVDLRPRGTASTLGPPRGRERSDAQRAPARPSLEIESAHVRFAELGGCVHGPTLADRLVEGMFQRLSVSVGPADLPRSRSRAPGRGQPTRPRVLTVPSSAMGASSKAMSRPAAGNSCRCSGVEERSSLLSGLKENCRFQREGWPPRAPVSHSSSWWSLVGRHRRKNA